MDFLLRAETPEDDENDEGDARTPECLKSPLGFFENLLRIETPDYNENGKGNDRSPEGSQEFAQYL